MNLATQVLYMGGGSDTNSKWAFTAPFATGDFVFLTFTISAGRICGFINGVRSGDCSGTLLDANRRMGTYKRPPPQLDAQGCRR